MSGTAYADRYVQGEAIAVFKNSMGETGEAALERSAGDGYVASVARAAGGRAVATFAALSRESDGIFVHVKSDTEDTDTLVARLKSDPNVLSVSPNYIVRASRAPNDPQYANGAQWGPKRIGAESAWEISTGSHNVHVAVLDTGIQRNHPDLAGNIDLARSRNFVGTGAAGDDRYSDGDGHGTHVGGIIGAVGNNGTGVAGINWNVNIIALRIMDDDGAGSFADIISGLNYLAGILQSDQNIKIPAVNLSLGTWVSGDPQGAMQDPTYMALKVIDRMNRTVIVVAAGNESFEVGAPAQHNYINDDGVMEVAIGQYCYPASFIGLGNMIVVGSTDSNDTGSRFTNWSSEFVDIAAPGGNIMSTVNGSGYERDSGTSMSAPHVAGAIALLASDHPDWEASRLKSHLLANANSAVNPLAPAIKQDNNIKIAPQLVPDTKVSRHGLLDLTNLLASASGDVKVESVTLSGSAGMSVGRTQTLTAAILPANAADKSLSWRSSDSSVASVSSGRVTAHKEGSAVITATALDGSGKSGTMAITVSQGGGGGGSSGGCSSGLAAGAAGLALLSSLLVLPRRGKTGKN